MNFVQKDPFLDHPPYSGLLIIEGDDGQTLLQGQLTCDVTNLSPHSGDYGAQCNRLGKVISLFQLRRKENRFELNMPRALVPLALNAIKKYAVFYKNIALTDASDTLTDSAPPLAVLRAGLPALTPDTSEKFFVHELNLHALGAISLNKGCYTGQEIIARMHYRGRAKSGLKHVCVQSKAEPVRGNDIYNATGACGNIVDYAKNADADYELLITAPLNSGEPLFMDAGLSHPLKQD